LAIQNFNVRYFMASTDSLEDNAAFAKKNNASFPILSDSERQVSRAYGVLGSTGFARRWTYYIDKDGVILHIDKTVSPRTAGIDLVRRLKMLNVDVINADAVNAGAH
jgi:peroxiredoxin Q/BCP